MSSHQVTSQMYNFTLPKNGSAMEMTIKRDGKVLGHIALGKGSFRWWSKGQKNPRILSWEDFFAFLDEHRDEFAV